MALTIPPYYRASLNGNSMESAIRLLKEKFQECLSKKLGLRRVTAPLFVLSGTGINDDLNGSERAVSFPIRDMGDRRAEVVHSLAKWKRMKLAQYRIAPGYGLYTDMNAIRADEELDNLHSLYVDQWDWERTMRAEERNLAYLKGVVRDIYDVLREVEAATYERFPHITPVLPDEITFIQAEELLRRYPGLTPKEREREAAKEYGAVFIIGIGGQLSDGTKHDGRAPDYDDWSTINEEGYAGLNGDIVLWNPVLEVPFELSSMGIRVDAAALKRQLEEAGCPERAGLEFHRALLDGELPLSIGGGIGQSRLCMFLLRCAHVGEVQASVWPDEMREACLRAGIELK
ncbi:aspartate--ammonia ligase [uncultured Rikenella sp.]|uniref:aspartate--ammonia ligase n=1 Tax=uncultured Rikenella sp. TaxID=368003 RepID=UPI00262C024D|nr:aspartate--ammonia ligase [uncultured Rikenella sp.]